MSNKTRHLSPLEYLKVLQEEWYVNDLRSKIAPNFRDRNFHRRVADLKAKRVQEMCERNKIPCIFATEQSLEEYKKRFIVNHELGMPIFNGITELDVQNYFAPRTDVKFRLKDSEKIFLGKIISVNIPESNAIVEQENNKTQHQLGFHCMQRIF